MTTEHQHEKLARNSHPSAAAHLDFVRDELGDFVDKRFWVVLPYDEVKDLPRLHLSPLGCVPQRAW
jgi:hypothetical protein